MDQTDKTADEKTASLLAYSSMNLPRYCWYSIRYKNPTVEKTDEQYMYEAYYSYPINDGRQSPVVFLKRHQQLVLTMKLKVNIIQLLS